jgi:hypothetical protein
MDAYDKYELSMLERFPEMLKGGYGGFAILEGWWPIVESLCHQIQAHVDWNLMTRERLAISNPYNHPIPDPIDPVEVLQIKEKFGGLRFYYTGGDDMIAGMVRMAECWAARTCEQCGNPGHSRPGGWISTLCDEHEAQRKARTSVQ